MATPRSHVLENMLTRRKHGTQIEVLAAVIHRFSMVAAVECAMRTNPDYSVHPKTMRHFSKVPALGATVKLI